MPYLPTAQAWLHHSSLLLQAQPTSTRITTKYTLTPSNPKPPKTNKPSPRTTNPPQQNATSTPTSTSTSASAPTPAPTTTTTPTASDPAPPPQQPTKATLTLKTYDPSSGICLKYRTDKAAEVGRLVASLGRLGRYMSGVPVKGEVEEEEVGGAGGDGRGTPLLEVVPMVSAGREKEREKEGKGVAGGEKGKVGGGAAGGGGGGGGGKKKKGKR